MARTENRHRFFPHIRCDTIRYDTIRHKIFSERYKLPSNQLKLPHGFENIRRNKEKLNPNPMSLKNRVRVLVREDSPGGRRESMEKKICDKFEAWSERVKE